MLRHGRTFTMMTYVIAVLAVIISCAGCSKPTPNKSFASGLAMGTFLSVTVPTGQDVTPAWSNVLSTVKSIEGNLSVFNPNSTISKVNANAGTSEIPGIPMDSDFKCVLNSARQFNKLTAGAFNPLVGPILEAWGFSRGGKPAQTTPDISKIRSLLKLTDMSLLIDDGSNVSLLQKEMKLDFGAIAKGYAVDEAFRKLESENHADFLINLGGNMRVKGQTIHDGKRQPWKIGIRNPLEGQDSYLMTVELDDGMAIATSGSYEQYVERDGRHYSHIIDPRSGIPVESDLLQVTVFAPSAMTADALSTACFVLGKNEGKRLIESLPQAEGPISALFITEDDGHLVKTWAKSWNAAPLN